MILCSTEYKDKVINRTSFNRLAGMVFGLDFEEWYQRGCWDDRYICHSIASGDEIIANVSISKMDLVINGELRRAIQIGTVMTHPDHRGQGHSKRLIQDVLDTYAGDFDLFYLFANRNVLDFYPRFGFTAVATTEYEMDVPNVSGAAAGLCFVKLDLSSEEDWELLQRKLATRVSVSRRLGVVNNTGLFSYYALGAFPDALYYCADEGVIVVAEHEGETLHLYDAVSAAPVRLERLLPALCTSQTRHVRFHFTPDSLLERVYPVDPGASDEVLFVRPARELDSITPLCYPKLAQA
ncbi:GNAT family N-acetyltransferase [Paenibacillus tepidiphilus]|uniref:GNAT family N-acetyltransferase n=1 Tax=Paenibacillus tepidiphilus TaxID=2608683 RepID=UPI00123B3923|nr:GNAT family N-acetyltransferase [Paenibacillus tepidiphilus]